MLVVTQEGQAVHLPPYLRTLVALVYLRRHDTFALLGSLIDSCNSLGAGTGKGPVPVLSRPLRARGMDTSPRAHRLKPGRRSGARG